MQLLFNRTLECTCRSSCACASATVSLGAGSPPAPRAACAAACSLRMRRSSFTRSKKRTYAVLQLMVLHSLQNLPLPLRQANGIALARACCCCKPRHAAQRKSSTERPHEAAPCGNALRTHARAHLRGAPPAPLAGAPAWPPPLSGLARPSHPGSSCKLKTRSCAYKHTYLSKVTAHGYLQANLQRCNKLDHACGQNRCTAKLNADANLPQEPL